MQETEGDRGGLDRRVAALEQKFYIAVGVAAVLGLSGAWGATLLSSAHSQITELEDKVNALRTSAEAVDHKIESAINTIDGAAQRAAASAIAEVEAARRDAVTAFDSSPLLVALNNRLMTVEKKTDHVESSGGIFRLHVGDVRYDFPSNGNLNVQFDNNVVCFAANDKTGRPNASDLQRCSR
jgi:outer membrane murein-binding lipoprotein Lpp